ncbi:MAG: RND transporter [Bacteroidetes bacterium]|nr:RND transporter [Bacteroidota bacterium]
MNSRYLLLLGLLLFSCHNTSPEDEEEMQETTTPVTVTHCALVDMQEIVELNAISVFLQKNQIKATTNGYLKSVAVLPGQRVTRDQPLFMLKGKEAEHLGLLLDQLDSSSKFTGEICLRANRNGFVQDIYYQAGDYVLEGDVLAEVSDAESLVFMMQLPYELTPCLSKNNLLDLLLPDGTLLHGTRSTSLPAVDPLSQTRSVVIRIPDGGSIPENLIAKVQVVKNTRRNVLSLPKAAVLADETLEHFWIMKMTDGEYAVKVPIIKGIETNGMVEIVSPELSLEDLILETGNYGLPDRARVLIQEKEE